MSPPTLTDDQIVDLIPHLIREHDWEHLETALKVLAVRDPHRAQAVIDTMQIGILLLRGADG